MIIIFEGCRNSGKTFLSKKISEDLSIQRYQFDFVNYFAGLNLKSNGSESSQSFSMGKDLMLMQLNRDGFIKDDLIIDRGFLTVLSWGILEKRVDFPTAKNQMKILADNDLTKDAHVIYIEGENPDKSERNKDQWDDIEKSGSERVSYELMLGHIESTYPQVGVTRFKNNFNEQSIKELINIVSNVRNNTNNRV
jgi:adenylate kinase family enzyme